MARSPSSSARHVARRAKPGLPAAAFAVDEGSAIPALDRALRIMAAVEAAPEGASTQALASLRIPRTSLYRTLGMLRTAGYLAELAGTPASYVLGPAIHRMAARVPAIDDLVARVQPTLDRLAMTTGETAKVVVRDGLETVAVAVCHPSQDSRVASRLHARLPLHVGAGQRLLLSRAPAQVRDAVFARPLQRRGPNTIVDPDALRRDLATLRKREWALGNNEGVSGVGSIGALIHEPGREVRAALVLLYILSGRSRREVEALRDAVVAAAAALSG